MIDSRIIWSIAEHMNLFYRGSSGIAGVGLGCGCPVASMAVSDDGV
jgi:hypothetical protein